MIICWHTYTLEALLTDKRKIASLFLQMADEHQFYLPKDTLLKLDMFANDVGFLSSYWGSLGRPLLIFPVSTNLNYLGLNVWLIDFFAEWSLFLQHFWDDLLKNIQQHLECISLIGYPKFCTYFITYLSYFSEASFTEWTFLRMSILWTDNWNLTWQGIQLKKWWHGILFVHFLYESFSFCRESIIMEFG